MATILSYSIPSTTIRASSGPGSARKPESNRKKPVSSVSWWAPLFGWSSDPDYVNADTSSDSNSISERPGMSVSGQEAGRSGHKFALECFTEEKAKELRRKMAESSSFHDVMYHSAIASRLASDVSGRVEK